MISIDANRKVQGSAMELNGQRIQYAPEMVQFCVDNWPKFLEYGTTTMMRLLSGPADAAECPKFS